jgi:hypothetical protein
LLDHDLVRARHIDGDRLGYTNSRKNGVRLSNANSVDLLDGNSHGMSLSDSVRAVHRHCALLDDVDWHRDSNLLHHVSLHHVRLRYANLVRNRLRLVDGNGDFVGNHLSDRHDDLDSIWDLYLLDNWHCLRDIDSLCLCDFNRIRNIHGYAHADGNRNGPSNLDGLRYFDGNGNVVRTRNFDRHLVWDDNFVRHSHLLCDGHLDLHRNFHRHGVGDIHGDGDSHRHRNRNCNWDCNLLRYRHRNCNWHLDSDLHRLGHLHLHGNLHGLSNGHWNVHWNSPITVFTVPNPNCTSQRRRFFQVWLPLRLPR